MSVVVGPIVARLVPPMELAAAAKAFQDEGVTDIVVARRDHYDEMCRWQKIGQAFARALDAAYEPVATPIPSRPTETATDAGPQE